MNSEQIKYPAGPGLMLPDDLEQPAIQAYFTPPRKRNYPERWLVLWQNESEIGVSMTEQAKSTNMTLTDYRVRDFLIGTIGLDNCVFVNQAEVARQLSLHRVTVGESFKRLCALGILERGPKNGRAKTYKVNPAFCFSGKLDKGVQARKESIKQQKAKILQFKKA